MFGLHLPDKWENYHYEIKQYLFSNNKDHFGFYFLI